MAGDDDAATGRGAGPDEGLPPGVEQLQQAALEAVRAARAMLDAAESAIRDPSALEAVVRAAAGMARTATETVAGYASGTAPGAEAPHRRDDDDGDDDPGAGYHDISVG